MATVSGIIRILVVEDFQPFRDALTSLLSNRPDLHVVGEVSDGLEAVNHAKELQPDLILLDIGLPSLDGIEPAGKFAHTVPHPKFCLSPRKPPPTSWRKLSISVRSPTLSRFVSLGTSCPQWTLLLRAGSSGASHYQGN